MSRPKGERDVERAVEAVAKWLNLYWWSAKGMDPPRSGPSDSFRTDARAVIRLARLEEPDVPEGEEETAADAGEIIEGWVKEWEDGCGYSVSVIDGVPAPDEHPATLIIHPPISAVPEPEEGEHTVKVERYAGQRWRGVCSCGWEGDAYVMRSSALGDADEHRYRAPNATREPNKREDEMGHGNSSSRGVGMPDGERGDGDDIHEALDDLVSAASRGDSNAAEAARGRVLRITSSPSERDAFLAALNHADLYLDTQQSAEVWSYVNGYDGPDYTSGERASTAADGGVDVEAGGVGTCELCDARGVSLFLHEAPAPEPRYPGDTFESHVCRACLARLDSETPPVQPTRDPLARALRNIEQIIEALPYEDWKHAANHSGHRGYRRDVALHLLGKAADLIRSPSPVQPSSDNRPTKPMGPRTLDEEVDAVMRGERITMEKGAHREDRSGVERAAREIVRQPSSEPEPE